MRRRATTRRLRRTLLVGIAGLGLATVIVLQATNAPKQAELSTIDTRFGIRGERPAPNNVIVVGIDDVTFNELPDRWVFPRKRFAQALSGIARDHPKAIAYDVEFDKPSTDVAGDNALVL